MIAVVGWVIFWILLLVVLAAVGVYYLARYRGRARKD